MNRTKEYLVVLRELSDMKYPDIICETNGYGNMEMFMELYDAGFIRCSNPHQIKGVPEHDAYCSPRITLRGRMQIDEWEREERESSIKWQIISGFKRFGLWVGIGLGIALSTAIQEIASNTTERTLLQSESTKASDLKPQNKN